MVPMPGATPQRALTESFNGAGDTLTPRLFNPAALLFRHGSWKTKRV